MRGFYDSNRLISVENIEYETKIGFEMMYAS